MVKEDEGAPAFPRTASDDDPMRTPQRGMFLRDWFAGQALTGLVTDRGKVAELGADGIAAAAYRFADAMVRQWREAE